MAISFQIYSNAYNKTKTVTVDFVSNIATLTDDPTIDGDVRYFFKFTTSARDTGNVAFKPRIVSNLSDLALNKTVQSASNVTAAYTNVSAMITDYLFDYIHGHTADQYSSGCIVQAPMKFST